MCDFCEFRPIRPLGDKVNVPLAPALPFKRTYRTKSKWRTPDTIFCKFCNFLNSNVCHPRRVCHFVRFLMTNNYANFYLDLRKLTQRRSPTIFNKFLIKAHGRKRTTCKIETLGGKDLLERLRVLWTLSSEHDKCNVLGIYLRCRQFILFCFAIPFLTHLFLLFLLSHRSLAHFVVIYKPQVIWVLGILLLMLKDTFWDSCVIYIGKWTILECCCYSRLVIACILFHCMLCHNFNLDLDFDLIRINYKVSY